MHVVNLYVIGYCTEALHKLRACSWESLNDELRIENTRSAAANEDCTSRNFLTAEDQWVGYVRSRGTSARGRSIKFYRPEPTPLARPHVEQIVCLLGLQQPNTSTHTKPTGCISAKKPGEEAPRIPVAISCDGNRIKIHEAIINTFSSLASGYQLVRNSSGRL